MDYRERKYYLVTLDCLSYEMRMGYLKLINSVKINPPYNHFKRNPLGEDNYDGCHCVGYVQFMLSCRKEDSDLVEFELNKAKRRDGGITQYVELTKEMCKQ